ncbi:hypothetical protein AVEN_111967-1, partial [Araneus ventricosus]
MEARQFPNLTGAEPSIGCFKDVDKGTLKVITGLPVINFTMETTHHKKFWSTYGKEIKEIDELQYPTERLGVVADYME